MGGWRARRSSDGEILHSDLICGPSLAPTCDDARTGEQHVGTAFQEPDGEERQEENEDSDAQCDHLLVEARFQEDPQGKSIPDTLRPSGV